MKEIVSKYTTKEKVTYEDLRKKGACDKALLKVVDRFKEELFTTGVYYEDLKNYVSELMASTDYYWLENNFKKSENIISLDDFCFKYISKDSKGVLLATTKGIKDYKILYMDLRQYFSNSRDCEHILFYKMDIDSFTIQDVITFKKLKISLPNIKLYWFPTLQEALDYIKENK